MIHAKLQADRTLGRRMVIAMALFALLLPSPLPGQTISQSYSDFYKSKVGAAPNRASGSNAYLYDKYFYNNPAVSPYLSGAFLGSSSYSGTAYTTTVRPEVQRREQAARSQARMVQQRKMQGNIGYTANPGAYYGGAPGSGTYSNYKPSRPTSGAYQNHWYGSWNK